MSRKRRIQGFLLAIVWLASGCGTVKLYEESYEPPYPSQPVYEPPVSGTIYNSGTDVRLFEDRKATRVGDIRTDENNPERNRAS